MPPLTDADLHDFWKNPQDDWVIQKTIEPAPSAATVARVQDSLGYTLPASYIALMHSQNGGTPAKTCFASRQPTQWAKDHVAIERFWALGHSKPYSLCGPMGSAFRMDVWEYPPIGVYFAEDPSGPHGLFALDYRACGPHGEPGVVHVAQECDYDITPVADDFETFVRGLVHAKAYDTSDPAALKAEALQHARTQPLGKKLQTLLDAWGDPALGAHLRQLAVQIVTQNDRFDLRADPLSLLMFDAQFLLHSHSRPVKSIEAYLQAYPHILGDTFGPNALQTLQLCGLRNGGFEQDLRHWLTLRQQQNQLISTSQGLQFTPAFKAEVLQQLAALG